MIKFNLSRWLRTSEDVVNIEGTPIKILHVNEVTKKVTAMLPDGTAFYSAANGVAALNPKFDLRFLVDIEPTPKVKFSFGETILCRDSSSEDWEECTFLGECSCGDFNFLAINEAIDEDLLDPNGTSEVEVIGYKYAKKLINTEPDIENTAMIDGELISFGEVSKEKRDLIKAYIKNII